MCLKHCFPTMDPYYATVRRQVYCRHDGLPKFIQLCRAGPVVLPSETTIKRCRLSRLRVHDDPFRTVGGPWNDTHGPP